VDKIGQHTRFLAVLLPSCIAGDFRVNEERTPEAMRLGASLLYIPLEIQRGVNEFVAWFYDGQEKPKWLRPQQRIRCSI
jgi:hypothetical protein